MEKKLHLSLLLFLTLNISLSAQQWVSHGTGMSAAPVCVVDISAPSDNVAWGILSVFAAGRCGGQVPYFTKTIDGTNWSAGAIPLPVDVTPVCISAISMSTAWIVASNISTNTEGYVYQTTDGGVNWSLQSSANSIDAGRFIHFFNGNDGVVVGDSSIFTTNDGGFTWIPNGGLPLPAAIGVSRTTFLLNSYEVLGNTIWLGDSYGYFYKSTDKGMNWTCLTNPISPAAVKGIAFRDSLYGIAVASYWVGGGSGSSGGSYADNTVYTTDGGNSWSPITFNFGTPYIFDATAKYDVAYVPGTANTFITTSEIDSSYAAFSIISIDGGLNWSLIDSTEQHTVCVFTSSSNGYTGGYIPDFFNGIFKWNGALPTAIYDSENTDEIKLSPNPASDFINISFNNFNKQTDRVVRIVDMTGKTVMTQLILETLDELTIDTRSLAKGMYVLQIENNKSTVNKYKFIR